MAHPGLSGDRSTNIPPLTALSGAGAAAGAAAANGSLSSSTLLPDSLSAHQASNGGQHQASLVASTSNSSSPAGAAAAAAGSAILNGGVSLHGSPVMGTGKHLNNNEGPGAAASSGNDCAAGAIRNGVANGGDDFMMDHGHDAVSHHHGGGGGGGGGGGKRGKGLASRDQRDASRGQKSTPAGGASGTGVGDQAVTTRGGKTLTKEEQMAKLEGDVKRLKIDLQISRNKENELRDQIVSYSSSK